MSRKLEELNNWKKTFPGMTAQEVSLTLARLQLANKANSRLLRQVQSYKDNKTMRRDLLPAAEDCYKALRELPSYCLSAWEGQKVVNRIRKYIVALENYIS